MGRKRKDQAVYDSPDAEEVVRRLKQWVVANRPRTPFAAIATELGLPEKRFRRAMQGKDELKGFKWEILDRLIATAPGAPVTNTQLPSEAPAKKELTAKELDRINAIQLHTISSIDGPVFCCIVGQPISPQRCLGIQGQPECFGCAAASRFCEQCRVRLVAFPEVELCGACLGQALQSEEDMAIPQFSREVKVKCPLVNERAIGVATCRSMQGSQCGLCNAPSRICEQCKTRSVRYPEYGLCQHCTVQEYGAGWSREELNQNPIIEVSLDLNPMATRAKASMLELPAAETEAEEKETEEFLTTQQLAVFFSVITDLRDRAMFAAIYHYALRPSEVSILKLQDVDIGQGLIRVNRMQRGIGDIFPLSSNTAELIKAYLAVRLPTGSALFTSRQGDLHRQRIQQLFKQYARLAGLPPHLSSLVLRSSLAVHLLECGVDIESVQWYLGHADIRNTKRYASLAVKRTAQKKQEFTAWLKKAFG